MSIKEITDVLIRPAGLQVTKGIADGNED